MQYENKKTEVEDAHQRTVCLVIIFNHRFDANIQKLKAIYQKRFHKIRFLMPFYEGTDTDVIPVYESSYQFPGFLIQAYARLTDVEAGYYCFIGDDLILSPEIDEHNILELLKMKEKSVFVKDMVPINGPGMFEWPHARFSSSPFLKKNQTQWEGSIPRHQDALKRFDDFFRMKYPEEYQDDFFEGNFYQEQRLDRAKEIENFIIRNGNSRKVPYPMAGGYSDIFLLKKEILFPVARLCGVFSAMNLFAEISFPTSVVLSVDRKDVVFLEETGFQSIETWEQKDRESFEDEWKYNFDSFYRNWDKRNLYIHPVKLSRWRMNL